MLLTDLFNSDAWQCHPTTPGPWRAADVLEVRATGELTGRHAPTRQGGPGKQSEGLREAPGSLHLLGMSLPSSQVGGSFPVAPSVVPLVDLSPPTTP